LQYGKESNLEKSSIDRTILPIWVMSDPMVDRRHYRRRWRIRMNKAAPTISLLLLWVLAAGCESQGTKARVHLRVFEVSTQALRLHTAGQNSRKLSDSAYSVSVVTPNELNAMLRSGGAKQRLLTERTRVINDWPAIADTWVYSPSYAGMEQDSICSGGGGGVGSVGVRERGRNLEVRLDYIVNHTGPHGQRLVESKIFYEHSYPEGQVLLFHTPSSTSGGNPRLHVIAFEVTRENQRPANGTLFSGTRPSDVLAYR
jgi:hypothetical protein